MTLGLKPADGEPLFAFQAGQFVMLQILNGDGSLWAQAAYSIASAPCESNDELELGIKIEGDFTQRVSQLTIGERVSVRGPYGVFTVKEKSGSQVFFAGGIGIAPIRSMIRDLLLCAKTQEDIFLFYSSKTRAGMAYEEELRDLATQHDNFYPTFCITQETVEGFEGECQRVNVDMVSRYFSDFQKGMFYMCGPVSFMDSVRKMLEGEGVDITDCLKKETF